MGKLGKLILIIALIPVLSCNISRIKRVSKQSDIYTKRVYYGERHYLYLLDNNTFLYWQKREYNRGKSQYSFGNYDIIKDTLMLNSLYNNGETEITVNEYLNPDKKSSRVRVYYEDDFSKEISACVLLNDSVFYPTGSNYVYPKAVQTIQFYDTIHGIFSQIYKVKDTMNNEFSVQIKYPQEIYQYSMYGDFLNSLYVFLDNYKLIIREDTLTPISKLKSQKQATNLSFLNEDYSEKQQASEIIELYFDADRKLKNWIYSVTE